jgi:hypothetical protein
MYSNPLRCVATSLSLERIEHIHLFFSDSAAHVSLPYNYLDLGLAKDSGHDVTPKSET